jgi:beta-phosphoglucomutase
MLEAIIFDFDGVIVDSEPLHYRAFLQTAREAGVAIDFSYDEYLRKYVGFDDREGFSEIILSVEPAAKAPGLARRVAALCESKKDVFARIVAEGFETIPGVLDFIASLPAAFPIAIASGATREDIELILGRLGIAPRFTTIVTASDVPRSKPDPATYRLALAGLMKHNGNAGLKPGDVLAIEDTAAGLESARGAGLRTLGLTTTTDGKNLNRAHRVAAGFTGLTLGQLQEWFG